MGISFDPFTGQLSLSTTSGSMSVGGPIVGSTPFSLLAVSGTSSLVQLGPLSNGQLLIGSTGGAAVPSTLTGTVNQVIVTNGSGSITLSLPQSIATSSSPTFNALTVTSLNGNTITTGTGTLTLNTFTLAVSGTSSITGTNTGDQTITLTGDVTGSGTGSFATTLATVNSNVGSFGSSTSIPSFTVNGKGLITAANSNVVIAPAGTLTGTTLNSTVVSSSLTTLGTIITGTWNGTTIAIANGGTGQTTQQSAINALTGTQSSGKFLRSDGTNATLSSITTGDVPTLNQNTTGTAASFTGNLTGDVTSVGMTTTIAKIAGTTVSGTTGSGNVVFSSSPTMTNPVVGTQSQHNNSTLAASTAYVDLAIANIISSNDISETTFTDTTDIETNVNVTGLVFSNANVRSFWAPVSVTITGSNLYAEFILRGIQRASDWVLTYDRGGDDTGVTFSITTSGQVQFSKTTTSSFTATKMVFRALTTKVF